MKNEQREAIEDVEEFNNKFDCGKYKKSINTVLSLIKENQKQLEKKDKQIDLMARAIDNYDSQLEINTFKDKEHIKQYFGELAEEE